MAGIFDKMINESITVNAGSEPEISDDEMTDEPVEESAVSSEARTLKKIREATQELLKYGLLEEASKPNLYRVVLTHPEDVARILEPLDLNIGIDEIRGLLYVKVRLDDTPDQVEWSHPLVSMPLSWSLNGPSDWIKASADPTVSREFHLLEEIIEHVDPIFHPLLVSHRSLWRYKKPQDIISAARLACRLAPGCAKGLPLRLLSGQGVDTKFIENNISLLTRLLDVRFSGEVSEQGLTTFLNAFDESSHWVLVVPLSPGLLPFKKCRVTTAELADTELNSSRILVVENEQCLHQLPLLSNTIAILGCGLDVQWLSSPALDEKHIGYWGDMDSWGLLMLARARCCRPTLEALLMNRELFERHARDSAVPEPVKAQEAIPDGLLTEEADFYRYLTGLERGRLEQEFLPADEVEEALAMWRGK